MAALTKRKQALLKRQARAFIRGIVEDAHNQGRINKSETRNRDVKRSLVRAFLDCGETYERLQGWPKEDIEHVISIMETLVQ